MSPMRVVLGVLVGALLGWVGALASSPLWLAPWAIASLVAGVIAPSLRQASAQGGALGFGVAYVFMLASYDGSASLASRLLPFIAFGAFGGVCAAALATAGHAVVAFRHRGR